MGVLGALEVVVGVESAGGFGSFFASAGVVVLVGVDTGDSKAANASVPSLVELVCVLEGQGGVRLLFDQRTMTELGMA